MTTSTRGVRGARGIKGSRGPSGKTGPKGVGRTGPKGAPGHRGTTGKKGTPGERGRIGVHGPAGTLAGSEHEEILIIQRRIEDMYEGMTAQIARSTEMQYELNSFRKKLQALTRVLK